jgi:hypothetical protein
MSGAANPVSKARASMKDLTDPRWIKAKGVLFVFLGLFSGTLLLIERPTLRTAVLLGICIWAFCRAYYFAFYVLERYVDPKFRFSGLGSALRYLCSRQDRQPPA